MDMDEWIEKESGKTVRQLFERGEDFFRDWESKACRTLAQKEGVILSTGGGVVKREENIRVLRKTGVVVFLDRQPQEIVKDVDCLTRPLLKNGPDEVFRLYRERIDLYRKSCDIRIDNDGSLDEVEDRISRKLNDEGYFSTIRESES